jgi:hypothetical protein
MVLSATSGRSDRTTVENSADTSCESADTVFPSEPTSIVVRVCAGSVSSCVSTVVVSFNWNSTVTSAGLLASLFRSAKRVSKKPPIVAPSAK